MKQKFVQLVIKNFRGERNGNLLGRMFCIAQKDAEEIRGLMFKLNLSNILIFFGSFPFILLSVLSVLTFDSFLGYNLDYLASLYSLVIACFICGSYWRIFLNNQKIKINLFILSNILTLILFFGFLILTNSQFILLAIFVFIFLLLVDIYIFKINVTDLNYIRTRLCVTTLVVMALIILSLN